MKRSEHSFDAPVSTRALEARGRAAIRRSRVRRALAAFMVATALGAGPAFAAEDWSAFLDALKTRGYDDVALVYLKQLQESGQAPPELDEELDYRVGFAAFNEAVGASGTRRDQLNSEATAAFEKYLESSPDGPSALEANMGLARIQSDRADRLLAEARRKGVADSERDEKLALARSNYSDAKKRFEAAGKLSQTRVKALQKDENATTDEVRAAQATHLDLILRYSTVIAQIARAYPQGSDEYKKGLTTASGRFADIFSKYQQYTGAYKARLSEAQIAHELGDDDAALEILSEIGVLPLEEEFYVLKTRSLALFAEIADTRDDPAALMELFKKFNEWSDGAPLPDMYYQSAEGRRIFLLAGKALVRLEKLRRSDYAAYADAGKKTFVDNDEPAYKLLNVGEKKNSQKLVTLALKTLSSVGSGRSEEALEAQELLKDEIFAGIDLSKYSFTQKADDFESAADIAVRAAATFAEKRSVWQNADESFKEETEREYKEAAREVLDAIQNAIDLSAKAVRPDRRAKLSEETRVKTIDEVNRLILKKAVVSFALSRYEDAFVAGDAVARLDDFDDAVQGATVALRSLQAMLAKAKSDGSSEVAALDERVKEYVAFTVDRWGSDESSPIAQESLVAQLESAAASGDVQGALDALAKIPEDSPRRPGAELRLGQALWTEWARRSAADSGDAASFAEEETAGDASGYGQNELLELARQNLSDGLEHRLTSDEGVEDDDSTAIYSTYLLAQVYAQQGDFANAEKWLTHPRIGALTVVDRVGGPDAAKVPAFVDDAFQISVLALKLRIVASDASRLEDAQQTMTRLDALVANSADAADASAKLTRVYLSLGKRFEERLSFLKKQADEGDEAMKAELEATAKGFEAFLNSVSERDEGNGYASMRWIAESYVAIAKEYLDKDGVATPEGAAYLTKARDLCKKILANMSQDPSFAPSAESKTAVLLKICEIFRYEGKYQTAYKNLTGMLKDSPNNVDVQWEAATVLENWGRLDPLYFAKAIAGDVKQENGSYLVWGWNGLIRRLTSSIQKDEAYKTRYFDACKAKVRTRFKYVKSFSSAEERAKQAQAAEDDVKRLWQTHPGFNGPETVKYFDDAYRGFQKLRGVKSPVGLEESGKKK